MFKRTASCEVLLRLAPVSFALTCASLNAGTVADQYRTNTLDRRVLQIPEEVQQRVFRDPGQFLEPLVRRLLYGARDDFHKTKLLHDWIADNIAYDVESYFSDTEDHNSTS